MFKYCVEYYDDIEGKIKERGVVSGETYEEALESILNYYGYPIISIQMFIYEDSVVPFNELLAI